MAVAVVAGEAGILVSKRHPERHQGGLWEFPGGKVEPGETVQAALVRELREELGIVATGMQPLVEVCHDYPDQEVLLDVWLVSSFEGVPESLEGQQVRWVPVAELSTLEFPAANLAILKVVQGM